MGFELVDFRKDVVEACKTVPVVIDFWAEWCGPCKVLGPIIEKLALEAKGRWKLVKIDTDKNPQIASQFAIQGIPSVKMVWQGKIVGEFTGALPEHKIREWLQKHLPVVPEQEEKEVNIDEILASASRKDGRRFLEQLVSEDPTKKELRARLAMYYLPGNVVDAKKLLTDLTESKFEIERESHATVLHLSELLKSGVPESTNTAIKDFYKTGVSMLLKEEFEPALDAFIQVMMRDRTFDDDGARKACVAIFAMLGEGHAITKNWRRRFSMALY